MVHSNGQHFHVPSLPRPSFDISLPFKTCLAHININNNFRHSQTNLKESANCSGSGLRPLQYVVTTFVITSSINVITTTGTIYIHNYFIDGIEDKHKIR